MNKKQDRISINRTKRVNSNNETNNFEKNAGVKNDDRDRQNLK